MSAGKVKDRAADKVAERVTLSKGELWTLRVAAITGVASLLSHGAELAGWVLDR